MWEGGEIKIWLRGGSLLLGDIFPGLEGGDEQIFGWCGVDSPHPPSRENPAVLYNLLSLYENIFITVGKPFKGMF